MSDHDHADSEMRRVPEPADLRISSAIPLPGSAADDRGDAVSDRSVDPDCQRDSKDHTLVADFDPIFYRTIYSDVARSGMNPLEHYVDYGRAEARYSCAAALRSDAAIIRNSERIKLVRSADAVETGPIAGFSILEHHLSGGWRWGTNAISGVDDLFYHGTYRDVRESGMAPAVHYATIGLSQGRLSDRSAVERLATLLRPHFDEDHYRTQLPGLSTDADAVEDYILQGQYAGLDPTSHFSVRRYVENYPDLASSGVDPFLHYIRFGQTEGRNAQAAPLTFEKGRRPFHPDRPTIVVAAHDASRTGAPLLTVNVAAELAETNNIVMLAGRSGPMAEAFKAVSIRLGTGSLSPTDFATALEGLATRDAVTGVIVSSVDTVNVAEGALQTALPTVALIHEFAEYSGDRVRRMVVAANRVVVPAALVEASVSQDIAPSGHPNNIVVRHQGYVPTPAAAEHSDDLSSEDIITLVGRRDEVKLVLGAGHVQIRKGVDLFVQTAADLRKRYDGRFHFLWVGSGYDPVRDPDYSVYLREAVIRNDLARHVSFVPAQQSLDGLLERAEVFFLPSRLDPFPNVAVDALRAGLPLVCFRDATGIAAEMRDYELIGASVDYCSTAHAAEAIAKFLEQGREAAAVNAERMKKGFSARDYATFVTGELVAAANMRDEIERAVVAIDATPLFDASFFSGQSRPNGDQGRSLRRYVAAGLKGLSVANPRPGFSDNLYRSRRNLGQGAAIVPLLDAIADGIPYPITHDCRRLTAGRPFTPFAGRTAIHFHLPDPARAADLARRCAQASLAFDIFVTTFAEASRLEIAHAFRGARGRVRVDVLGRHAEPLDALLFDLREALTDGDYDIVAHFAEDGDYLSGGYRPTNDAAQRDRALALLLGQGRRIDQVAAGFNDRRTGLVFAETAECAGWVGTREIADRLSAGMTPPLVLPAYPCFPISGSFWVRRSVLDRLCKLDLAGSEMLADDPSRRRAFAAIQRALPALCEATGYHWQTVYAEGPED